MPSTNITVGAHVEFDTEHGPQAGIVEDVRRDLGNGQRIAMVYVVGTLNRASWLIPVEQLQCIKAAA
jgi:hypothetical protein